MKDKACPSEADLISFVDSALTPERLKFIATHVERCRSCEGTVKTLASLIEAVAEPLESDVLDIKAHVESVMNRLDEPVVEKRGSFNWVWVGAMATAAAVGLAVFSVRSFSDDGPGQFTARGGTSAHSLARDVGVTLFAKDASVHPLTTGDRITPETRISAAVRNVGKERAFLLLFAIDSHKVIHWIAPEYTVVGSDPASFAIEPSKDERLLPSAVTFDDLNPGSLRILTLLTAQPIHVSSIETLAPEHLTEHTLQKRFPEANLRMMTVEVVRSERP